MKVVFILVGVLVVAWIIEAVAKASTNVTGAEMAPLFGMPIAPNVAPTSSAEPGVRLSFTDPTDMLNAAFFGEDFISGGYGIAPSYRRSFTM